jgi:predicted nucleic acid-binding protein
MRIDQYVALLDACVLAPMPVADTLLRLASEPAFYTPRWSAEILGELHRTLIKFGYPAESVARRVRAMQEHFPEALVEGYDALASSMTNHPKDRHVLAAAVKCGAHAIVSNNKKHFPEASLAPYGLECLTADHFLEHQYHLDPDAFIAILMEQAAAIGWTLPQLLSRHEPSLSRLIKP